MGGQNSTLIISSSDFDSLTLGREATDAIIDKLIGLISNRPRSPSTTTAYTIPYSPV